LIPKPPPPSRITTPLSIALSLSISRLESHQKLDTLALQANYEGHSLQTRYDGNRSNALKFVRFDPVVDSREDNGDEREDRAATDAARGAEWLDNVMKDLSPSDR
jgi:hypothetical protein